MLTNNPETSGPPVDTTLPTAGPKLGTPFNYTRIGKFISIGDNYIFSTGFKGYQILGEALAQTSIKLQNGKDPLYLLRNIYPWVDVIKKEEARIVAETQEELYKAHPDDQREFLIDMAELSYLLDDKYYRVNDLFAKIAGPRFESIYHQYVNLLRLFESKTTVNSRVLDVYTEAYRNLSTQPEGHIDGQIKPLIAAILLKSDYASTLYNLDIKMDVLDLNKHDNMHARLGLLIANNFSEYSQLKENPYLIGVAVLIAYENYYENRELSSAILTMLGIKIFHDVGLRTLHTFDEQLYSSFDYWAIEELNSDELEKVLSDYLVDDPSLKRSNIF